MKRNLLFVAYQDDNAEESLSYALELARMMDKGIAILLVRKRKFAARFENLMAAVTFAEANEHETAKGFMRDDAHEGLEAADELKEICRRSGFAVNVYTAISDTVKALKEYLSSNTDIEMVLLSPGITDNGAITSRELNRLVRSVSKPVVTITKNARAAV